VIDVGQLLWAAYGVIESAGFCFIIDRPDGKWVSKPKCLVLLSHCPTWQTPTIAVRDIRAFRKQAIGKVRFTRCRYPPGR